MITIYHNPRCGKSREGLALLQNMNAELETVKYLETPLNVEELKVLISKLKLNPIEIIRQKESVWITNFKGKKLSDSQIIQAMVDFPILIERPIVVSGNKAVIARPVDKIITII
jgi:arsenate reductase